MRALVFLVIGVTVFVQGLSGRLVAGWLGVRRPSDRGYVILGAHHLGVELGRLMRDSGDDVVLIDANPEACRHAQESGFQVFHGNAMDERILMAAGLDTRRAVVATLPNEAINLLFARKAREDYKVREAYVAIQRGHGTFSPKTVHDHGAAVLFGNEVDLELWSVRIRRKLAETSQWRFQGPAESAADPIDVPKEFQNVLMPFARLDAGVVKPLGDRVRIKQDDKVAWLIFAEQHETATTWLNESGWVEHPVAPCENDGMLGTQRRNPSQ